jgi:LCP family protein required for cell wall assembly
MSQDDPFKGWYQNPPASDATQDMTVRSPMPGVGGGATYGGQAGAADAFGGPGVANGADAFAGGVAAGGAGQRAWPTQPPVTTPGGPSTPPAGFPAGPVRGGRRWRFWGQPGRRGRRIALYIGIVVVLLLAGTFGSYFWINGKLDRSVSLPAFAGTSAGTNWLIVGSDTRGGLTRAEADKLHLGTVGGAGAGASDSLMLLHMGAGKPVLISIPRDSYVTIPGFGQNKINAALAFGGPSLLVKTIESVTGLRIDHYMGIGFGGLVGVVNEIGGVRICLPTALNDSFSGVKLSKGCHNLNGAQALAFVRDRHSFATSDLQRIEDQRAFLKALLAKATSPGVYLNPFTSYPFASSAAGSVSVDKGTSAYALIQVAFALRNPQTGTVPIANPALQTSNAGEAVEWNQAQALELFNALKDGKPVPAGLLTGTQVGSQSG